MTIEMQDESKFYIKDQHGIPVECDTLFRYESAGTGKCILVFTDGSIDEDGNTKAYACYTSDPIGEKFPKLLPIEEESEWNLTQKLMQAVGLGSRKAISTHADEEETLKIIEDLVNCIRESGE